MQPLCAPRSTPPRSVNRAIGPPQCTRTTPTSRPADRNRSGQASIQPAQQRAEHPLVLPLALHHEAVPSPQRVARPCPWRGPQRVLTCRGPLVQEVRTAETYPYLRMVSQPDDVLLSTKPSTAPAVHVLRILDNPCHRLLRHDSHRPSRRDSAPPPFSRRMPESERSGGAAMGQPTGQILVDVVHVDSVAPVGEVPIRTDQELSGSSHAPSRERGHPQAEWGCRVRPTGSPHRPDAVPPECAAGPLRTGLVHSVDRGVDH